MMKTKLLPLVVLFGLVGCGPHEEEETANGTPPPQTFEGTVDKRFVGTWENGDKSQVLTVKDDGSAQMKGFANTPAGKKDIDEAMEWKADAAKLSFKMKDGMVQKYAFKFDNDSLELKTSKTTTIYKKSK